LKKIVRRRDIRKRVRLSGWMDLGDRVCIGLCRIRDISDGGARLRLDKGDTAPARFVLRLTQDGSVGRICERMWSEGSEVGVRFVGRVNGRVAELDMFPPLAHA
jgi:hypothetical protein